MNATAHAPDLLLIDPPARQDEKLPWQLVSTRMPGLGLAQIAAAVEHAGHRVAVLDCNAEGLSGRRLEAHLGSLPAVPWVGITATTSTIGRALECAEACRRQLPGARIVLGGVHPTVRPDEVLAHPAVDCVVRGEGELTMLELLEARDFGNIAGLSFRDGSGHPSTAKGQGVVHNPDRAHIADLDSLPLPAYHLFPLHKYRPGPGTARRFPALSMVATRGCPGRCTYCFPTFGPTLRLRSMDRIIRDVQALQDRFGVRQIQFFDDTFTASRRRVRDFCTALLDAKIRLSWACYARVDTVDAALLGLMAAAGCHQICYGIESGDPAIIANIKKRIRLDRVRGVVALTRQAGIHARGTFMLGNPGETVRSMETTLELALNLDLDLALFNISTPYPGTALFSWAQEQGYLSTTDWSLYDRAHMVMSLPTVDSAKVEAALGHCYRRFYGRPRYLATRAPRLVPWRGLLDLTAAHLRPPRTWTADGLG